MRTPRRNKRIFKGGKQFIFRNSLWTVSLFLDGRVTIFQNNRFVYMEAGMKNTGFFPDYTLQGEMLSFEIHFLSDSSISVRTVKQSERTDLPKEMIFHEDPVILDKNGDGIIENDIEEKTNNI